MDNIPGENLHDVSIMDRGDIPALLRAIAGHHDERADKLTALRKKGHVSDSRELRGVADHLRQYADALEGFTGLHAVTDPLAAPALPGNTGRCASFRRATPDDAVLCSLDRGHEGDHSGDDGHDVDTWPRQHSGQPCGDVVILPDGTALNCVRPLGHDGDEHYDGRFRLWPRGAGTRREVRTCERCNYDTHRCPGCGEPLNHFTEVCDGCKARETDDGPVVTDAKITSISLGPDGITTHIQAQTTAGPAQVSFTDHNPQIVPPCGDPGEGTSCMLPKGHTGKHIGYTGARWDQVAKAETLADIADRMRTAAAPSIPEQRAESDPVPTEVPALAAVAVAEMKEEVSATVAELTGDEPAPRVIENAAIREIGIVSNPLPQLAFTSENGYSVTDLDGQPVPVSLSNPFAPSPESVTVSYAPLGNPFMAPPPPPAAFLPPHLVPGEPKAHQSHSSITTMEKCGLQYRLKYRDGIGDDTPAWWNVAGTAFHHVVQTIEAMHASHDPLWALDADLMPQEREAAAMWKATFAGLVTDVERENGKARGTWKAAKGGKEGEAFWREFGGDLARTYVHHRRAFLEQGWRLLTRPDGGYAQELPFDAEVSGVRMKGFLDTAWISADATTILVEDYKSGSSEGDPFQLKLYGAALRAIGADGNGTRRVVGRFYEARKGAHSDELELTAADDAEVSYRANTAQAMDRAGIFPPNPSGYNCSTCPAKSRCPIMASKS